MFGDMQQKQTALIGKILNVHKILSFYKFVTAFVSDRLLLKSIPRLFFCEPSLVVKKHPSIVHYFQ